MHSTDQLNRYDSYTWAALNDEVGATVTPQGTKGLAMYIQTTGTGSVIMQVSADGSNWLTMKDTQGEPVVLSGNADAEVSTAAAFVRAVEVTANPMTVVMNMRWA